MKQLRASSNLYSEKWRECSDCWFFKEWSEFNKDANHSTWYKSACKPCRKIKTLSPLYF